MTLQDLRLVLDWAADEGWNPGLDDAEAFFAADPEGFFVAEVDGAPVAAISVVNHGPQFAFLGLYICRPAYRRRGIGRALWQHAIAHAGDRTIGLDGVQEQQDNYFKSGFRRAGETTRYSGMLDPRESTGIRRAESGDISDLVSMEAAASGSEKVAYLSSWFRQTDHRLTLVLEKDDEMIGLATVRKCRDGAKVGPLVATNQDAARALLHHAAGLCAGPIILDVPATSPGLDAVCQDLGMTPGFQTARMYRGDPLSAGGDWYAVATLELG